jgi:hypothetical protein
MPDMPEDVFLRRVAHPDLIERRGRRRARHRAEEAGLTEEQLRDREDEKFRISVRSSWLNGCRPASEGRRRPSAGPQALPCRMAI